MCLVIGYDVYFGVNGCMFFVLFGINLYIGFLLVCVSFDVSML